jgi:hypothetical protein
MAQNFKKLKHLAIHTSEVNQSFDRLKVFNNLKDEDLKIIEKLNLKRFRIFRDNSVITDKSLESLAKFQNLGQIHFNFGKITDSGICHLIKNSPKLKILILNDKSINETTIEAFIEKALNNPKSYYQFIVCVDLPTKRYVGKRITDKTYPRNLMIRKLGSSWE